MKRTSLMITREGWYYLGMMGFIIAGAVIRDINLLYIMAGMMLGPLLFSFYAASRSLRRLSLRRRFESLVAVDEPLYGLLCQESAPSSSRLIPGFFGSPFSLEREKTLFHAPGRVNA